MEEETTEMWVPVSKIQVGDIILNFRDTRRPQWYVVDIDQRFAVPYLQVTRVEVSDGVVNYYNHADFLVLSVREGVFTHIKVRRARGSAWANAGMAKRFEDLVKSLTSSPVS